MSFAEDVKNEAAHYETNDINSRRAELAALLCMGGTVLYGCDGYVGMEFSTANNAVARRVLSGWRLISKVAPEVSVRRGLKLRKKNYYILRIVPGAAAAAALAALDVYPPKREFPHLRLKKNDYGRAFLRGAFMGSGSVNKPNGEYLVYIKEGNGVSSFLQYIGADKAYLDFESVRVVKEMRNNVNRIVNCETANLQKTVDAAINQIRDIEKLRASGQYGYISLKLQETAELRLANPEATLGELAELSGLTKSGLSHRFQKIRDIVKQLER